MAEKRSFTQRSMERYVIKTPKLNDTSSSANKDDNNERGNSSDELEQSPDCDSNFDSQAEDKDDTSSDNNKDLSSVHANEASSTQGNDDSDENCDSRDDSKILSDFDMESDSDADLPFMHENEGSNEACDVAVQSRFENDILKSNMSVYKLVNSRIKGINDLPQNNTIFLREILVNEFEKNRHIKHHLLNKDKSGPFFLTLFSYRSEQETDFTTTLIATQRKAKDKDEFKGKRDGGSILVHYRFDKNIPEVFFLCSGTAYHGVLHLSDPHFRTQVAKHYMDGERVKEVETINIAGPDILSKLTYREPTNIATLTPTYLERAVSRISGTIKPTSKLYRIIKEGKKQNINLEIGMNVVRIGTFLSYEQWADVLALFSNELANGVDPISSRLTEALDYVQRIDPQHGKELSKKLWSIATDTIAENNLTGDLYLSHRYTRDWIFASSITLSIAFKKDSQKIKTWTETPTFPNIIKEIHNYIGTHNVKQYLDEKKLMLGYQRQGKQEMHPVQDFVHGQVDVENGSYYKLGQKWYRLSSTFSQVVDRNFKYFADSGVLRDERGEISELLSFPWNTNVKHYFELKDVKRYFELPTNQAKQLLDILMNRIAIIDKAGTCLLTESSCLLPNSSELYMELKPDKKKRKSKTSKTDKNQDTLDTFLKQKPSTSKRSTTADTPLGSDNELSEDESVSEPTSLPENVDVAKSYSVCGSLLALVRKETVPLDDKSKTILRQKRYICAKSKEKESKFVIVNSILTEDVLNKIKTTIDELRHIEEHKITKFLRFMSKLSEGEYNEMYLHYEEHPNVVAIPGDRIESNGIELFDILIHEKSLKSQPKTYLFHCKEKFGNSTRDSCAQIRNSSELLWHDFRRGETTHIQQFFDYVINYKEKDTYRILLKEKMKRLGKDKFFEMFSDNAEIIFVYAFLHGDSSDLVSLKFKPIVADDLIGIGNIRGAKVLKCLEKANFLKEGYLADTFISMTQIDFIKQCGDIGGLQSLKRVDKTKLYNTLCRLGKCKLSTIAKLELLTLDNCFARYQIGGNRRFKLKFVKIKSP